MGHEIELKLEIEAEAMAAIDLAAILPPDAASERLRSLYFDTPEGDLAEAGLSLRIRRAGRKRMQTVKADGGRSAGLFARPEWERPVRNDIPILDDQAPIRAMIGDATDRIGPIFEVLVDRRSATLENGSTLEIALDSGEVVAGERATPVHEIELELKEGEQAALFNLARRIDGITPVRLAVLSKSERGYRLLDEVPHSVKAGTVRLRPDMNVAEAFREIAFNCIRHFRLNETLLGQNRLADPLHQARVALRRLRSAFSIFKSVTATPEGDRLRGELRWLAGELGNARNLDVILHRAEPGDLHDRIAKAREAAYDRVEETLATSRARHLMLDLVQWLAIGDWLAVAEQAAERNSPAREFAVTALDRFRRKVKKDGRDLAAADDEHRHETRKDAKKLRYAAEFFVTLFDRRREKRRYKAFVKALEGLQDVLGRLNDLATAPGLLDKLGLAGEADASSLLAGGKKPRLVSEAADAYEDLLDAKRFWR